MRVRVSSFNKEAVGTGMMVNAVREKHPGRNRGINAVLSR